MKQQTQTTIITAKSSHTPVTPRKANLVLDSIKGMKPQRAIDELAFVNKFAAKPIIKLLKQAVGNAADQYKLSADQLTIDQAFATKARVLKRVRFAGRGRIKPYEKVSSHLTIILRVTNPTSLVAKTKAIETKKKTNQKLVNKK